MPRVDADVVERIEPVHAIRQMTPARPPATAARAALTATAAALGPRVTRSR